MKKNYLFLISILLSINALGQINSSTLDCGIPLQITYEKNSDNSVNYNFKHTITSLTEVLTNDLPYSQPDLNNVKNKQVVLSILNKTYFQVHKLDQVNIRKYDIPSKTVTFDLNLTFSRDNFFENNNQIDLMYENLKSYLSQYNKVLSCSKSDFRNKILEETTVIKDKLVASSTSGFTNSTIKKINNTTNTKNSNLSINNDIRNPVAFTSFLIRNPTINGKSKIHIPSNFSSYHYIRPGSIINILFVEDVYTQLDNVKLSIEAYLKRLDGTIIPVNINGYFEVNLETNQNNVEQNQTKKLDQNFFVNYNYTIKPKANYPIQSEINPNPLNPQVGEKIFITVTNRNDNNSSFSTVFEFEDFGWVGQADGGFSWVNTIKSGNHDFVAAGSSSYNFHYKLNKGDFFVSKFFMPSFGPELLVLQDSSQKTLVGLGINVSTFMRTFKVGYGWYLNGNNGRPYVSVGVNFVEGYKSISSILNNVKAE